MTPFTQTEKAAPAFTNTDSANAANASSKSQPNTALSTSPVVEKGTLIDPVFGEIREDGPDYRSVRALQSTRKAVCASTRKSHYTILPSGLFANTEIALNKTSKQTSFAVICAFQVGWVRTGILMMKTQVGIGVLSIPGAFAILGLVPGVIALVAFGIITTWSDYQVGFFKLRHPEVYSLDGAGFLMFGKTGREVFMIGFQLYWIFVTGSAFVSVATALNALSSHGACTAVFVAVSAIAGFLLASVQTLSRISWLAWAGMICILASVFTVTIAVGVQDRPASAPQTGPWVSDYQVVAHPTFAQAMSAVSSIIFAYSGTPAFFAIISEQKNPRHCFRSIALCQSVVFVVYLIVGVVVYYYCGSFVASPALGSAGPVVKKVAYGIALPGLLVSTMIVSHIPAKNFFVRILRGSKHLTTNTFTHWAVWLGCTFSVTVIGYIIASAIPAFSGLVSLIGALLGTFITIQPYGAMWLYDNWKGPRTIAWMAGVCWAIFVILTGWFFMAAGTYGSVLDIIGLYNQGGQFGAWSCADNSDSS